MLLGAPDSADKLLFEMEAGFTANTNCVLYAMQYYRGAYLTDKEPLNILKEFSDRGYLARPGQSKGVSLLELYGTQPSNTTEWQEKRKQAMIKALKTEGALFQGTKYPKKVPDNKYVVCCFLNPVGYHFLRQNKDGMWTGKDGRNVVSEMSHDGKNVLGDNPEKYYNYDKNCPFVGYFLVPAGGINLGLKKYIKEKRFTNNSLFKLFKSYTAFLGGALNKGSVPEKSIEFKEYLGKANNVYEQIDEISVEVRDIYREVEKKQKLQKNITSIPEDIKKAKDLVEKSKIAIQNLDKSKKIELRYLLNSEYSYK